MKVSFIIVSWNVEELLKECIQSILGRSCTFPVEVIVVDNASQDGSAEMVSQNFPSVKLVRNNENRGFGAACNQGIAIASGEYILLLNPDSTVKDGALEALVSYMDTHRDVAVCAPQILNTDGTVQQSVRKFPSPLSQLLIVIKLRRFTSIIPTLRNYFALDFDYSKDGQEIDQPMGAAMLIRVSVLKKIGVFDEQFFVWFEEVDLCKRIKDAGYRIVYCASAHVVHHSGKSFSQQNIFERQKNFFRSCARYLRKQCGVGGMVVGALMAVFAWGVETVQLHVDFFREALPSPENIDEKKDEISSGFFLKNIFLLSLFLIGTVELLSFFGYLYAPITALAFGGVVAGVFLLGVWKLEYATAVLFAELIIGSKGYLLSITVGHMIIPLRMGLFAVVIAAWIITEARIFTKAERTRKTLRGLFRESRLLKWYFLILAVAAMGVLNGIIHGTSKALIYADSNAWLFFIVAPCAYRAFEQREALRGLLSVLTGAMTAQIVKVLIAFYVMGHKGFGKEGLTTFYRWVRSTGVGEITQLPHLYRIFFQSQIYSVVLICILAVILAYRIRGIFVTKKRLSLSMVLDKSRALPLLFLSGACASLVLSFSRSFWLGTGIVGCGIIGAALVKWRHTPSLFASWIGLSGCAVALSFIFLLAVSLIPIPSSEGAFTIDSLSDRVKDVQDEAAAASRWNLLPVLLKQISQNPLVGYGFGKTVTYVSHDPRVLLANSSGRYTTYAFEWGYLDILMKLGFLGLIIYLCMIRELFFQGMRALKKQVDAVQSDTRAVISGCILGIGALLIIHALTPYLNHPLGIGLIIAVGTLFERFSEDDKIGI